MSDKVSQGARELAQSIVCGIVTDLVPDYIRMALHIDTVKAEEAKAAEFIDRDLREVMEAASVVCNWIGDDSGDCHAAHKKLSALLAKWTVRG